MKPVFLAMAMIAAALTLGAGATRPLAAQGNHTIFVPGLTPTLRGGRDRTRLPGFRKRW